MEKERRGSMRKSEEEWQNTRPYPTVPQACQIGYRPVLVSLFNPSSEQRSCFGRMLVLLLCR